MSLIGTIVNAAAILAGGGIGLIIKKGLNKKLEHAITQMLGLTTVVIAGGGLITRMITVDPATGKLSSGGELLLLVSLVLGALAGTLLDIDGALERWGARLEKRFGGSGGFAPGLISATLLFCVGAMAIMGSFNDGLSGDHTVLFVKSALDFISSIVLGATLGAGVLGAAVTTFAYQGALTLCAGALSGVLVGALLDQICIVGYAIVACIGINFFGAVKIKTANLLPALLVPLFYQLLQSLLQVCNLL